MGLLTVCKVEQPCNSLQDHCSRRQETWVWIEETNRMLSFIICVTAMPRGHSSIELGILQTYTETDHFYKCLRYIDSYPLTVKELQLRQNISSQTLKS